MCNNVREYTCRLLEAMDAGLISTETVAHMALQYMSEDEVFDLCKDNDLVELLECV